MLSAATSSSSFSAASAGVSPTRPARASATTFRSCSVVPTAHRDLEPGRRLIGERQRQGQQRRQGQQPSGGPIERDHHRRRRERNEQPPQDRHRPRGDRRQQPRQHPREQHRRGEWDNEHEHSDPARDPWSATPLTLEMWFCQDRTPTDRPSPPPIHRPARWGLEPARLLRSSGADDVRLV